jgi:TRAP-type C4-dicarboxylate transport system permease small subunit
MKAAYVRAMDGLYLLSVVISGVAIVVMTTVIPYGVFTRYVLNSASSWPEPLAVLMMIVFSFFGGAVVYRVNAHISVVLLTNAVPDSLRPVLVRVVDGLMALICLFMVIWGYLLVEATMSQVTAEFPWLPVGITYLPIPAGGAATILFIIERVWAGPPPPDSIVHSEPVAVE